MPRSRGGPAPTVPPSSRSRYRSAAGRAAAGRGSATRRPAGRSDSSAPPASQTLPRARPVAAAARGRRGTRVRGSGLERSQRVQLLLQLAALVLELVGELRPFVGGPVRLVGLRVELGPQLVRCRGRGLIAQVGGRRRVAIDLGPLVTDLVVELLDRLLQLRLPVRGLLGLRRRRRRGRRAA